MSNCHIVGNHMSRLISTRVKLSMSLLCIMYMGCRVVHVPANLTTDTNRVIRFLVSIVHSYISVKVGQ